MEPQIFFEHRKELVGKVALRLRKSPSHFYERLDALCHQRLEFVCMFPPALRLRPDQIFHFAILLHGQPIAPVKLSYRAKLKSARPVSFGTESRLSKSVVYVE